MADVTITEFSDPGCPFAWSAEPFRRKLQWIYADQIGWKRRMVVLADSPADYEAKGFTTEMLAGATASLAREHGMPIDTAVRPRLAATAPACRAVVATRLRAPASEEALLRAFRVRHVAGDLLDDPATVAGAASDAGLDGDQLAEWMRSDEVERALDEDRAASRQPTPAALAHAHKLAEWSGGMRYTCPSYEIVRSGDGEQLAVPGFQPFAAYEVALANLLPEADRREPPSSVLEVLEWAGEPLATREVAVVCEIGHDEAREQLGRVATERHIGFDGLWSPA